MFKVTKYQQFWLKLNQSFILEHAWSNEQQFKLLKFIHFQNLDFIFLIQGRIQEGPFQFWQSIQILHLGQVVNWVLSHNNCYSVNFLVKNVEKFSVWVKGHVGHTCILITLFKPSADFFNLLSDFEEILWCFFFNDFVLIVCFFVSAEQVLEILVEAHLHHGLFHQSFLDGLIMLVVDILSDEISQLRAFFCASELGLIKSVLVWMEVLLFFDHLLLFELIGLKLNLKLSNG